MSNTTKKQKIIAEEIEFENIEQAKRYLDLESAWIDEVFTKNWPKIYSSFAHWANRRMKAGKTLTIFGRIATFFIGRLSGLTIHRNKQYKVLGGKGFRTGFQKGFVHTVVVKILKHKKEVAIKSFNLTTI